MSAEERHLLRWHGAKATFSSLMQHLELDPKAVRMAGDWSSSGESMPDVYLREAQLIVLKGQEACLHYLRAGGDFGGLVNAGLACNGLPPGSDPRKSESNPDGVEKDPAMAAQAAEARAAVGQFRGVDHRGLASQFFDGGDFGDANSNSGVAASESADLDPVESLLEVVDPGEDVYVVYAFDSDAPKQRGNPAVKMELEVEDKDGPVAEVGGAPVSAQSGLEDEDHDLEGLTDKFVMLDKPHATARLHLPAKTPVEQDGVQVPAPVCGARGDYCFVKIGEALDPASEPCSRCFGKRTEGACTKLCSMRFFIGGAEFRCARRCAVSCTDTGVHLCHVHGF